MAAKRLVLDQPPYPGAHGGRGRLRPLREADLHAVAALERRSYPHPWPTWFFRRIVRGDYLCCVAEQRGELVGYGIMQLRRDWAHIMNVCVDPDRRGQGWGTRLMLGLMRCARAHKVRKVWLEVRPSNTQAITLYRRLGFRRVGRRRHYYRDRWGRCDAVVMIVRW